MPANRYNGLKILYYSVILEYEQSQWSVTYVKVILYKTKMICFTSCQGSVTYVKVTLSSINLSIGLISQILIKILAN